MSGLTLSCSGNPQGQPLVLVHGWGFTASAWDSWLPQLENDYAVTRVSLPGFGTDTALLEDLNAAADALATQLAAAGQSPAIWVGWSLGGQLAAAVAARHPALVQGLLTLGTNPCFVANGDWPGMSMTDFDSFYQGVRSTAAKTLGRFLMLQGQGDSAAKQVVRELKPALATAVSTEALLAGLDRLAEDQRDFFAQLTQPRRFLFGAGDGLVPAAVAVQPMLAPYARVLADCGHGLFLSAAEVVTTELCALQQQVRTAVLMELCDAG
ncbi:MAG TPA: alpha/beta fold hydrolase [Motiliproteus sp.]